jgi:7,8-didemethyl-8-hydroxy-5-deazariboflavin synthase CofG subunit
MGVVMDKLTALQASQLGDVRGEELNVIRQAACAVRDNHWGKIMTYSRKVFIPLTNMCRDECQYCTFVQRPESGNANIMTPEQVLTVIRQGQAMGCKEVLLSLGEKPELRYREAREALAEQGFSTMMEYVAEISALILRETTLLPHVNAGTMTADELAKIKKVSASMGMMLETVSDRLLQKGQAHFACPDKVPAIRLATIKSAGEQKIPYTTGILIGIGETWQERVESLEAINNLHLQYGHIQEVIVQNFCAKSGTAMVDHPEPDLEDMLRTLAVARLMLDPSISIQAPPNLQQRYKDYIGSGINDWGGISPLTKDFINPERAWPQIEQLAKATQDCGYQLQERLAVYPNYLKKQYLSPQISKRLKGMARADGLAYEQCVVAESSKHAADMIYHVAL